MGVAAPWPLVGAWNAEPLHRPFIGQLLSRNQVLHKNKGKAHNKSIYVLLAKKINALFC